MGNYQFLLHDGEKALDKGIRQIQVKAVMVRVEAELTDEQRIERLVKQIGSASMHPALNPDTTFDQD